MTAVRTIGIMTGNSLDGVDIVLTGFENGRITDLGGFSKPYSRSLTEKMLRLRARIREEGGRMERLVEDGFSLAVIDEYTSLVAETVNTFLPRSGCRREDIAALGFHGQTCDHFPPSIAGGEPAYTGSGRQCGAFGRPDRHSGHLRFSFRRHYGRRRGRTAGSGA